MQPEPDHVGNEHAHRLTQHGRFRFNTANAPTQHAKTVDHGRVRVGANQRIAIRQRVRAVCGGKHHLAQILEIHLMTNAGARRHHAKIPQRGLAPLEELVPFIVAIEFQFGIEQQ